MVEPITIEKAVPEQVADVRKLVVDAGLNPSGIAESVDGFLVATVSSGARDGIEPKPRPAPVVGTVCVERYQREMLLRSLAVHPSYRGRGLGTRLVDAATDYARTLGCSRIVLLTTDAERFFARLGFAAIARDGFASAVTQSPQYKSECPASAIVMARDID
jgi:amino-acid N-acetyltransferase